MCMGMIAGDRSLGVGTAKEKKLKRDAGQTGGGGGLDGRQTGRLQGFTPALGPCSTKGKQDRNRSVESAEELRQSV